jgi:voltage-gated potassium channel
MALVLRAIAATLLVTLTLSFQSAAMAALIHWARAHFARAVHRFGVWHSAVLLVRFTGVIFASHVFQILLWAVFYRWNCFPSWESAFYFSTASYSTVGYGDVVLPNMWRNLGPIESVTGVLMCGLSVSLLFAIVIFLVHHEEQFTPDKTNPNLAKYDSSVPARRSQIERPEPMPSDIAAGSGIKC